MQMLVHNNREGGELRAKGKELRPPKSKTQKSTFLGTFDPEYNFCVPWNFLSKVNFG